MALSVPNREARRDVLALIEVLSKGIEEWRVIFEVSVGPNGWRYVSIGDP